ncbi:uncharacterized protein [Penaeus vannamei]|uniref:uncharacterized protein n=1 Tax=Penaeus vannamei TaxID=6689 RepID=UPI00387FAD04
MDWILGRTTVQSHCGATLGNIKVTVLAVYICGGGTDVTEIFTLLCGIVDNSGLSDQEVSKRIDLTAGVMNCPYKSIWRCRYLCRRTKLRIFRVLIIPVLLYVSETWTLSYALESNLNAFCNRSLRRIMGYCWRYHVSSQQLHRDTGTSPVICTIRDRQLRLYST